MRGATDGDMKALACLAWVLVSSLAMSCNSSGGAGDAKGSGSSAKAASATAGSASAAPLAPALAAVKAGTWKDPYGGPDSKLVDTPLGKCFGFKGYSMKAPEGSQLQTLEGARACGVYPPSAKNKEFGVVVFTDEVKVNFWKKEDVKDAKAKPFEEEDAFLWKVERRGKEIFIGFFEKKIGPRTVRCNSLVSSDKTELSFETERAVLEVCRTITYSEP